MSLMPAHVDGAQANRWGERAVSVGIRLVFDPSYLPKQVIESKAMLTSMGLSWFRAETGQMVAMKVPRRGASFTARKTLDLDLVHEERNFLDARTEIVEMSPFGLWALQLAGISQHLKYLQELQIVFVGTARHSAEMRVALRRYGEALLADRTKEIKAVADHHDAPTAPALPFALGAGENEFAGPNGARVREAVKLRLLEDALYDPERGGDVEAQA